MAISCRGVTRRYTDTGSEPVTAVDRATLDVRLGEFVAIQGPSGSGKTTLLGLLAGLERADEGTVTVVGHDLARLTATERARLRREQIGIVLQSFGLVASLDAAENVGLPLRLDGIPPADQAARVAACLEEVGLAGHGRARIDELSSGERQRVAVARALAIGPSVILADEPTGSLDDETAAGILALLSDAVRRRGAAFLLVTHDPASAALADRGYAMRDGRVVERAAS